MNTLKTVVATLVVGALVAGVAGAGVLYSGIYNVGADSQHLKATYWLLNKARQRSVAVYSADIQAPTLGGHEQLVTEARARGNGEHAHAHGSHGDEHAMNSHPSDPAVPAAESHA
ncbi:MAG: hypothetical protein PF501_17085 [Salinisphaera sp.]|jgi:hypothetical protein|nr:hypothetical protein [Salinisphaera sp.]